MTYIKKRSVYCAFLVPNMLKEKSILISVIKDSENENPVPEVWRAVFCDIVYAFSHRNYLINSTIPMVNALTVNEAQYIESYIESYGEKLTELPIEAWETSIYLWMGDHWSVMIDLWTLGEGRSDLVLSAKVFESSNGYIVNIDMVYVP
ncbi:DUF7668 domain-containing protein [Algibacillus agarilyticus]|uniref:DUF7668 domain-containing protein n=1 Tax=Algibacillus agarilyticus TaxID=2234133 RepID=UPI0013005D6D|nr:hypothetical protein [Algibacillus agarilyticus]